MQMGFVQKLVAGLAAILTTVALFTVVFFSSREAAHVEEALEDKAMVMVTLAVKQTLKSMLMDLVR